MEKKPDSEILAEFAKSWRAAVGKGDFHAAIDQGIAAYLFFRTRGNENHADGALGLVSVAIDSLLKGKHKSPDAPGDSCSFCGRSGLEVCLGAGQNAFICSDCVAQFHKIFGAKPQP